MKIILILLFLLPCISNGLTFKDGEEVDNSQSNRTSQNSTNIDLFIVVYLQSSELYSEIFKSDIFF